MNTGYKAPRQLTIAGVALAASVAGIGNDFVWDDVAVIQDNARLHSLTHIREIFTLPFWPPPFQPDLYRPVASLLFTIEHVAGGGAPIIFRLVSYLLYALVSVGVFELAARLMPRDYAFGAALIFAAHPLHVEAVALGMGQSELLVALISLVAVALYLQWRRANTLGATRWSILAVLYVAASLSKEQGFVLPALLLCAELLIVGESLRIRARTLASGYALLAMTGAALIVIRRMVLGSVAGSFTADALAGLGPGQRALTMLGVVPHWARLFAWPARLRLDYQPLEFTASTGLGAIEITGLLLTIMTVAVAFAARRKMPALSFGLSWMMIALLPVSNVLIPTGVLIAERTLLLPSVGVVIAAAALLSSLIPRVHKLRPRLAGDIQFACMGLVAIGVLRSAERQRVWRSDGVLAVRTVQDSPRSYRAQQMYGAILFEIKQQELALDAYHRAILLSPHGTAWRVRNDLAARLRSQGAHADAVEQLVESLREQPNQPDIRTMLVGDQLKLGRYQEAAAEVDTALALGAPASLLEELRAIADSAERVSAPPGSIDVRIGVTP